MQPLQLVDLITLALVEGVADVLPVDAKAHALLASWWLHWRAGSIGIAIHSGMALALILYLWRDIALIGQGLWRMRRRRNDPGALLLAKTLLASLPWIVVTIPMGGAPVPGLGAFALVGGVTVFCALVMAVTERMSMTVKRIEHVSPTGALALGLFQLLGLIPGVGRVAALVTGARLLGLERIAAFRFTLLVQIPVLLATSGASAFRYYRAGARPEESDLLSAAMTFVFVLVAVTLGMRWIGRFGLTPFALYRLLVGALLLGLAFS